MDLVYGLCIWTLYMEFVYRLGIYFGLFSIYSFGRGLSCELRLVYKQHYNGDEDKLTQVVNFDIHDDSSLVQ